MKTRIGFLVASLLITQPGLAQKAYLGNKDIDAIFNQDKYKHAEWGLRVVDESNGKVIINLEPKPNHQFYIGSVRKTFSIGAFLNQVGADYRFKTPVSYRGEVKDGVLQGDLILTASGDMVMGGRTLPDGKMAYTDFDHNEANTLGNATLTKPDPLAGYKKLAKDIYAAGIKHVTGNVIIDDSLFVPFNYNDEFNVSAIFVNDNVIDVIMNPGLTNKPAKVDSRPISQAFTVTSTLMTSDKNTQANYQLNPELPKCFGTKPCKGKVSGQIPVNFIPPLTHKLPLIQTFRITKPANYARTVFIEALKEAGVKIDANPVSVNPAVPKGATHPITELVSLPYSEYAKFILKVSYNIGANTTLVLYGLSNGVNNIQDALKIEKQVLETRYAIPANQFHFVDGGGGGETRATTQAVTHWLASMLKSPAFPAFFDALPVLGKDGSLATITHFQANPSLQDAAGQVFAKTGTYLIGTDQGLLLKGQAFAGYIHAQSGKKYIYEVVVNQVKVTSIDDVLTVFQDEGTISAILWRDL